MADVAHALPTTLSGGQQQSVAIARALANDPPIITADEPTGNLDSKTAAMVLQLFQELVNGGKTVLMVTHDDDLATRAQRTIVLSDGEIVREDVKRNA
jgi:putative ABC transport system ATP-binding protein